MKNFATVKPDRVSTTVSLAVMYTTSQAEAKAVSCWLLTMEARAHAHVSPHGICGDQSGTGAAISQSPSVYPCQYHFTPGVRIMNGPISSNNNDDKAQYLPVNSVDLLFKTILHIEKRIYAHYIVT